MKQIPYEPLLKEIGLTDSEIKIYLLLLKQSPLTKSPIVKATNISGSKVYEVLHRLSQKGLVSITTKNNIKQFSAASPEKIKDYLQRKKDELNKVQEQVNNILPSLFLLEKTQSDTPEIAIFTGWEGMATVYQEELAQAKKGDKLHVIGASKGANTEQTERFFSKYGSICFDKGLNLRMLFNTSARDYVKRIEQHIKHTYNKRFLFQKTPTEVSIFKETIFIVLLRQEPIIIRIKNKETADSFRQYFEVLWEKAKP